MADHVRVDLAANTARIGSTSLSAGSRSELRSQLSAATYTHLHIRNPLIENMPTTGYQDLADELIADIPHRSIWQQSGSPARQTVDVQGLKHHVVTLGGVKVLVPHHDVSRLDPSSEAAVRTPSWRTRTTPGYVLALGASGIDAEQVTARIYVTCDSAAQALELWPIVLDVLAKSAGGYQAKALSSSLAYPRSDAMVLYVPDTAVQEIADRLTAATARISAPHTEHSIFTQRLSPRFSQAGESADPRPSHRGLSFGQHRSRVLTDALLTAAKNEMRLQDAWAFEATRARIDPRNPATNL
ncbi:hypothetical protein CQ010_10900 [Arthrobacter sp. MYb211]|nr:hypothetical protein CIK76_08455 [Glutamicibacter sp. BW80]PQZ98948.1 hypothetical protein CQ017_08740 [Arthrobacter sp. MYb224]PRA03293.1 hypothetical protein CQ019_10850 [Arthrobacter sp. MYb229]PRA11117.1 hypothetical protein CQ015_11615 [Arthrobacter sp. MYb221]PRB49764.1 hypothetical protein CQ013_12330 [Arthrobacter sp. MYb216]PRC07270.1 hypothetical protein CQ010_10900 [Arthrobacter sp. MYb211]